MMRRTGYPGDQDYGCELKGSTQIELGPNYLPQVEARAGDEFKINSPLPASTSLSSWTIWSSLAAIVIGLVAMAAAASLGGSP